MKFQFTIITCLLLSAISYSQNTYYVDMNANGLQDGSDWQNAFLHPDQAIQIADSGDSIFIGKGTYYVSTDYSDMPSGDSKDFSFHFTKGLKVFGGFSGSESHLNERVSDSSSLFSTNATILSADLDFSEYENASDAHHIITGVNISDSLHLDGFIMQHSYSSFNSVSNGTINTYDNIDLIKHNGAVVFNSVNAIISNCLMKECASYSTSVIRTDTCYLKIKDSYIIDNGSPSISLNGPVNHQYGTLDIEHTLFSDNVGKLNGGVTSYYTDLTVHNSKFIGNEAASSSIGEGGAIKIYYSDFEIDSSTFIGNSSQDNGGVLDISHESTGTIKNSNFTQNIAAKGGVLYITAPFQGQSLVSPQFLNCVFSENVADSGGVVYNQGNGNGFPYYFSNGNPTFTNCLFYDNTAQKGGVFYNLRLNPNGGGIIHVTNSTLSNNYADEGGAAFVKDVAPIILRNSIVWDNEDATGNDLVSDSLQLRHSIVQNEFWVNDVIQGTVNTDSIFVDPANNNYHILQYGVAINKGSNSHFFHPYPDLSAVSTDLDGSNRFFDNTIDLGCYENQCAQLTEQWFYTVCANDSIEVEGDYYSSDTVFTTYESWNSCLIQKVNNVEVTNENVTLNILSNQQGSYISVTPNDAEDYIWFDCNDSSFVYATSSPDFYPSSDGEYYVEITKDDCVFLSDCISFETTSLEGLKVDAISIYPNPAKNELFIDGIEVKTIEIFDVFGRKVIEQTSNELIHKVDLTSLSPGSYSIRVNNKAHSLTFMITD